MSARLALTWLTASSAAATAAAVASSPSSSSNRSSATSSARPRCRMCRLLPATGPPTLAKPLLLALTPVCHIKPRASHSRCSSSSDASAYSSLHRRRGRTGDAGEDIGAAAGASNAAAEAAVREAAKSPRIGPAAVSCGAAELGATGATAGEGRCGECGPASPCAGPTAVEDGSGAGDQSRLDAAVSGMAARPYPRPAGGTAVGAAARLSRAAASTFLYERVGELDVVSAGSAAEKLETADCTGDTAPERCMRTAAVAAAAAAAAAAGGVPRAGGATGASTAEGGGASSAGTAAAAAAAAAIGGAAALTNLGLGTDAAATTALAAAAAAETVPADGGTSAAGGGEAAFVSREGEVAGVGTETDAKAGALAGTVARGSTSDASWRGDTA